MVVFLLLCAGALRGATEAHAQQNCQFLPPSRDVQIIPISGGGRIAYAGNPHLRCSDGVELWADSLVAYSVQSLYHMIGNVRFQDETGTLEADEARYFLSQARLQANGNVFVEDTVQGYSIENGSLIYLRAAEFREEAQIDVTIDSDGVQPSALLTMKPAPPDTTAVADSLVLGHLLLVDTLPADVVVEPADPEPASPFLVRGNRIFIQGDTYFRSVGNVVIERDSLLAYGDSADYDQAQGRIALNGSARVDGDQYDLNGRTILMSMVGDRIDRVRSVGDAELIGDDLRLTSAEILLFLVDGGLDRLVAIHDPDAEISRDDLSIRPVAFADDFEMTADSLDISAPGQRLERILAIGTARSVSDARDSLNVETLPDFARSDWLEGDTIIVTFAPDDSARAASGDAAARVENIIARGRASSLYRLLPSDSTSRPGIDAPAIHYVVGAEIVIAMVDGEVDRMEVEGQTQGLHLEPLRMVAADSLSGDSTAVIDTLPAAGAAVDTSDVRQPRPAPAPADDSRRPRRTPNPAGADPMHPSDPWKRP